MSWRVILNADDINIIKERTNHVAHSTWTCLATSYSVLPDTGAEIEFHPWAQAELTYIKTIICKLSRATPDAVDQSDACRFPRSNYLVVRSSSSLSPLFFSLDNCTVPLC